MRFDVFHSGSLVDHSIVVWRHHANTYYDTILNNRPENISKVEIQVHFH